MLGDRSSATKRCLALLRLPAYVRHHSALHTVSSDNVCVLLLNYYTAQHAVTTGSYAWNIETGPRALLL
jgi:hypothetical protein